MKTNKCKNALIAFAVLINSFDIWACRPMNQTVEQQQIMHLIWRAERQALLPEDFELIDQYLMMVGSSNQTVSVTGEQVPLRSLLKVISSYQFDHDYLKQFKGWALRLDASELTKQKRILNDIIWWSDARKRTELDDLWALVKSSEKSEKDDKVKDVMALMTERGMAEELRNWSTYVSFKKSDLLFDLAIRKAKIVNLFNELPVGFTEQLENELILSLNEIFPVLAEGSHAEYQHLQWLFIEMGKNRALPEVESVLMNLKLNPLHYHQQQLKLAFNKVSKYEDYENIDDVKMLINERLQIIPYTLEALDPENPYSSRSYYGCM